MSKWLVLMVAVLCAGCGSFRAVGTPGFQAQVEARLPEEARAGAVTGRHAFGGFHRGMNNQLVENTYSQIFSITGDGLYTAHHTSAPTYHKLSFNHIVSARISTKPYSGFIELTSRAPGTPYGSTYIWITDDGVDGTSSEQKTLAFLQRLNAARSAHANRVGQAPQRE